MRYETILFDLDGTLLDTIDDLGTAVNHALSKRGLPLHSLPEYRLMVGGGIRNLNWRALPEGLRDDEAYLDACLDDFLEYYVSHIDVHTRPYPGMQELLRELSIRGASLAVTSNKFQAGTEKLVRSFFPDVSFTAVFGNRKGAPLKPDPAIVEEVLKLSGSPKEKAVLVGDSSTDIKTARNGCIDSIAVSWGFRPREELSEAGAIVDSAGELAGILLG